MTSNPARAAPRRALVAAVVTAALAAACGDGDSDTTEGASSGSSTTVVEATEPVGIIAIGHSGLTGENSDPDRPGQPALENSWATGTSPEVDSIYLRLAAARPETEGHVANEAQGGAPSATLRSQLAQALDQVPNPALVIIQTIDGDLRCDLDDPELVSAFGANVAAVLDDITTAAPDAAVLMVDQLGRPSTSYVQELVAAHPEQQAALTWDDECSFFDPSGQLSPAGFANLTEVIERFEAEQARVCATVPTCRTDGGARAAYVDTFENMSADFAHLNARGNAAAAALVWPIVADMLGVD